LILNVGNYNELLNIEDAFRMYVHRYISKDVHPRHYLFSKFLLKVFKNKIYEKDIKHYQRELGKMNFFEESEIIPYDILMDHINLLIQDQSKFIFITKTENL
jgi:hypothetical protein